MPKLNDLLDDTTFYHKSNEELIKIAHSYSAAQRDIASKCSENNEFWHHIALADLLTALARRLSEPK